MGKSKYPQKLDTSVELPAVRDSALSDPINSLRSAIIQIERTLGVNPQGATGNTVASRISRSLDSNGNILESALTQAGLLSGPIDDKDVAETAAIKERKLDLNFPTQVLQDEISMLQSDLDAVASQISEISVKLSTHISFDAANRHPATAISLSTSTATASSTATLDLSSSNVQDGFDAIYNQHINYNGDNISETNNSHLAEQIYFDNTNVSGSISADNVQDAIEAVATSGTDEKSTHQDTQHSNGILRLGKLESPGDTTLSQILAEDVSVSFSSSDANANGTTTITISDTVDLTDYDLRPFDFIIIEDPADTSGDYTGTYEIQSFTQTGSALTTIDIFGLLSNSSTSSTTINIGKNVERRTNEAGLLVTSTEEATLTSSRNLLVADPNAIRVISSEINPMEITSTNKLFNIVIDGVSYEIDVYDATLSRQTIDSIISNINETLVENAAHAMAYRLDFEDGGSEIAIVHTIPDDTTETHTLVITRASDGGIDALGFSYIEDLSDVALYGTKYFINGQTYSGLKEKLDSQELAFFAGSNNITTGNSSINFLDLGIKVGDMVIVTDATDASDNGSYFIDQVTASQMRIDNGQLPSGFANSSSDNTRVRIFASTISLEDITFDKVGSSFGSTLIDIFMDKNRDIFYNKTLEYQSVVVGSEAILDIVDIEGNDFYNETITISADENPDDTVNSFLLSIDGGDSLEIFGTSRYIWAVSNDKNIRLKIYVSDASTVASKISTDGTGFSVTVYLNQNINDETNMPLARALYNNFNGRIAGGANGPRVFAKVPIGTLSKKDISQKAKEELIYRPLSELRYNGVIYGFEIENISIDTDNFYNLDIRRGVAYVNGRRIVKDTVTSIITDIDATSIDKIYIVIDEFGNFTVESAIPTLCITPFGETEFAILGSIEFDGVNVDAIDLRLFIDHLDLKILNEITVSPQKGLAHFSDPVKAIKYAKRFSEMFADAGTPIVKFKSGTHIVSIDYSWGVTSGSWDPTTASNLATYYDQQIESGMFIDFSVVLEGEGAATVIQLIDNSTFTDTTHILTMPIVIAGNGFTAPSRGHLTLGSGDFVEIKNMTLLNSRVSLVDFNLTDGSGDLRLGVHLDNVIFDYQTFPGTFIDGTNGPRAVELLEINDTSRNKGSLDIYNCTFIKCGFYTDSVARTKNLNIVENLVIDDDDSTNFLFNDIYSFTTATSGSNINISNNRYNTNLNANDGTGPEIVAGGTLRWGERFDRDIRVGNVGYFEDSTEVVNNHNYSTAKTKYLTYYADDLAIEQTGTPLNLWNSTGASYGVNQEIITVAGTTVIYPFLEVYAVGNRFKIKPPFGGKLLSVEIGYRGDVTVGTTVTCSIYSLSRSGGLAPSIAPATLQGTDTANVPLDLNLFPIDSLSFDFVADDIDIVSHDHYLVQVDQNDGLNNFNMFYIRVEIEVLSIEAGVGIE